MLNNRRMLSEVMVGGDRPLAEGLDKEQMDQLLDAFELHIFADDAPTIVSEGELDQIMYIVRSGEASVRCRPCRQVDRTN